jgi:hypothetical protein
VKRGGYAILALSVAYLYCDSIYFAMINRMMVRTQVEANQHLPQRLVEELRKSPGRLWNPQNVEDTAIQSLPHLGQVIYDSLLGEMGIPTFTRPSDTVSYGSETSLFFDKTRHADYEIFNISRVLIDPKTPVPSFFTKVADIEDLSLYKVEARGDWDVIRVASVYRTKNEWTWYHAVKAWMKSSAPAERLYASFVPNKAAAFYPGSVPKAAPLSDLHQPLGKVVEQSAISDGAARAVMQATDAHQYGLLRTAYHPRWKILRNGLEVSPVWVGPGYLAFPLEVGLNRVEATFRPDLVRRFLFSVSLAMMAVCGLAFLLKLLKSYQLLKRWRSLAGTLSGKTDL